MYSLNAVAGAGIEATAGITSGSFVGYPRLDLYGPDMTLLRHVTQQSGVTFALSPAPLTGTYYLVLKDDTAVYNWNYNLSVAVVPGPQGTDPFGGGVLTSGQTVSGQVVGNLHVYSFTANAGAGIEATAGITGGSYTGYPRLDLYGPDMAVLAFPSQQSSVSFSLTAPLTGTYYLVLKDATGVYNWNYNLTVTFVPAALGGSSSPDVVTLRKNGTNIDYFLNGALSPISFPIGDSFGFTINGNGGNDIITLDYTNGNPLPNTLHLNGTFTINGLAGSNPLANTTLDIGRSTVFINYAGPGLDPAASIKSYLQNGYSGGAWNGSATASSGVITSADAKNNALHNTGIGWADFGDGTGVNTTPNTIKLAYTLNGDATLNGAVDIFDLNALLAHYNLPGAWTGGDSTYNGQADIFDLNGLLANYNTNLGSQAAPAAVTSAAAPAASPAVTSAARGTAAATLPASNTIWTATSVTGDEPLPRHRVRRHR